MLEVPESPKIYTTVYDNFKGVDFTNDATNVWKRRSPTGKNMLPDSSGRPFKRHGWDILLSNADLCDALSVDSCKITKCSYFEIAGVDHIVIFTDAGVIFYNGEVADINTEYDCYSSYERNFFFEGNGTSGFYIYGNFRMWMYTKDFELVEVTDKLTVPTVLIGADALGVGTVHYGYNLLGNKAAVEYCPDTNTVLFDYWNTGDFLAVVNQSGFSSRTGCGVNAQKIYSWKATVSGGTPTWTPVDGGVAFATVQNDITISGDVKTDDMLYVINVYGVSLPNNVAQQQITDSMEVYISKSLQFDKKLPIKGQNQAFDVPAIDECRLITDSYNRGKAWVQFSKDQYKDLGGEDYIRVVFPSVSIDIVTYSSAETPSSEVVLNDTATLIGGVTP